MEVRKAEHDDQSAIATVARASLSESYNHFIDQDTIVEVVEEWYAESRVADLLADGSVSVYVAEVDDQVVGFVQSALVEADPPVVEIHWLHVSPQFRDEGVGVRLLGRAQDSAEDSGAAVLKGYVLAANEDGVAFYEDHAFEVDETKPVEIGGEEFEEAVLRKPLDESPGEQVVEPLTGPDGQELFVNYSEAEHANVAAFYAVFADREFEERYGYQCGNCDAIDVTMDSMGRIVCNECENSRKATRWDASYL
jgi:ribosomal protein S18 acetylase RimI-like enzyme